MEPFPGVPRVWHAEHEELHYAVFHNNVEWIRLCLSRGANVDYATVTGTPLYVACMQNYVGPARLLIDHGADVSWVRRNRYDGGTTPMWEASYQGHVDIVRLLLGHGAEVDPLCSSGYTPLGMACQHAHVEVARLCLAHGSDISRAAEERTTPYESALRKGYVTMAAWLKRIQHRGWKRHLSEPRYALVVLKELTASGRARRRRASFGKEQVHEFQRVRTLDFLFPSDPPPTQASKPRLPDDVFSVIARYYWGGGMSSEEEAAHAREVAARRAARGGY